MTHEPLLAADEILREHVPWQPDGEAGIRPEGKVR